MSKAIAFTITRESIIVVMNGKTYPVQKGSPNFLGLRNALNNEDWEEVPKHLTIEKAVKAWSNDKFIIEGGKVTYLGESIPYDITTRIISMVTNGENPTSLFNFYERLQKNPSFRSVEQLYGFLKHENIPITPEGFILTYKMVRQDYKDVHSGTFDNSPGTIQEMPRNKISDDPLLACHDGFHVGALSYAQSFHSGGRLVVCKVDPEHVVCVPHDSSSRKVRVCKYEVIGLYGSELPSTSFVEKVPEAPEVLADEEEDAEEDWKEKWGESDDDGVEDEVEEDEESEDVTEEEKPVVTPKATLPKKVVPPSDVRPVRKGFAKYSKLDMGGLLDLSLDELRKYATYGLSIVGASKIPGGKVALVDRIIKSR